LAITGCATREGGNKKDHYVGFPHPIRHSNQHIGRNRILSVTVVDLDLTKLAFGCTEQDERPACIANKMSTYPDTHSKVIGYLLWLFGFTGSHRFYFGEPITRTIWFFTGGLFLIGWIVDLFLIPSMDRDADRRFAPEPDRLYRSLAPSHVSRIVWRPPVLPG
jgi:TM2 domain-containing membrane protein YozV